MDQMSLIHKLYGPSSKNPHRVVGNSIAPKRRKIKRVWMDAGGGIHKGSPPAEIKGSFVGNQGTVRRSSKGATYIMPNGRRYYEAPWSGTAIAYQA